MPFWRVSHERRRDCAEARLHAGNKRRGLHGALEDQVSSCVRGRFGVSAKLAAACAVLIAATVTMVNPVGADGAITVYRSTSACESLVDYGVGLQGDGAGTIEVAEGPGPVIAAFLEWVGYDDTSPNDIAPGGDRADSELTVNGVTVVGVQPPGEAGYAPSGLPDDWYAWYADVGPTGLGLVSGTSAVTLEISGYDSPVDRYNNGASLVVVYDTSPCDTQTLVEVRTGVDYYWEGLPDGGGFSLPIVYEFPAYPTDRVAKFFLNHAGTDFSQTECRGDALWLAAGSGAIPDQIVTNDGRFTAAYGVNGGVEGLDDPFGGDALPCTTEMNPVPDVAPGADHPYPGGASEAPYSVVGFEKTFDPEWTTVRVDVVVPAEATWVVFQLESESDQRGESGASVGGGPFVVTPSGGQIGGETEVPVDVELTKGVGAAVDGPFVDELTTTLGGTVFWKVTVEAKALTTDGDELGDLTGVSVADVLPAGLTLITAAGEGAYDPSTGVWTIGELAKGTSVSLVLETTVDVTGEIVNAAEVSTHVEDDIDSVPGNGPQDPTEDDEDTAKVSASIVDVSLTKLVDGVEGPVNRERGDQIVYTLSLAVDDVTDEGLVLGDVTGLKVSDVLPPDVTFVSATGHGTYDAATGQWLVGDLAAGSTVSLQIAAVIDADARVEFDNVAEVIEHDQPDIDSTPGNGPQDPIEDDDDGVTVKVPTVESDTETPGGGTDGGTIPATGAESQALWFIGVLVLALGFDLLLMSVSIGRLVAARLTHRVDD